MIHNAEDGFMAGTGGKRDARSKSSSTRTTSAPPKSACRSEQKPFTQWSGAPGSATRPGSSCPARIPASFRRPRDWSALVAGDDVVRTRRFGHADCDGALLLRHRQRRPSDAAAHRAGGLRPAGQARAQRYAPHVDRRVFSRRTASELRGFLRMVVLHGTGNPTAQIPGYSTAGKTGTAEMVVDGEYRSGYYAASFIGMVPYEHPRYRRLRESRAPHRLLLRKRRRSPGVCRDFACGDAARRRPAGGCDRMAEAVDLRALIARLPPETRRDRRPGACDSCD